MVKRKQNEHVPPWSDTPLDHWSANVDPAIMAGDEWVDNSADPGAEKLKQALQERPPAPFMHPTHDTNYGIDDDRFLSEETESTD